MKRKGKNWELPILGNSLNDIRLGFGLTFYFDSSKLEIDSRFILRRYGIETEMKVTNIDDARKIIDLYGQKIQEAIAYKSGELFLKISGGYEIYIEDGPYENWHYIEPNKWYIHGGIGQLSF